MRRLTSVALSHLRMPCRKWSSGLILLPATLLLAAQASRPNFSGRWELDKTRSDFGSLPPDDSAIELIEHQEPKLTITQVWKNAEGEHSLVWQLTTDGAENLTRMNEIEIVSRTIWEDQKLVTDWRMKRGAQLSEGKNVRLLSEDRKTLSVAVRQSVTGKEIQQHLIFVESPRQNHTTFAGTDPRRSIDKPGMSLSNPARRQPQKNERIRASELH